jgi:hypothetical protein
VFQIGILQFSEHPFPHARLGPAIEPLTRNVNHAMMPVPSCLDPEAFATRGPGQFCPRIDSSLICQDLGEDDTDPT